MTDVSLVALCIFSKRLDITVADFRMNVEGKIMNAIDYLGISVICFLRQKTPNIIGEKTKDFIVIKVFKIKITHLMFSLRGRDTIPHIMILMRSWAFLMDSQ